MVKRPPPNLSAPSTTRQNPPRILLFSVTFSRPRCRRIFKPPTFRTCSRRIPCRSSPYTRSTPPSQRTSFHPEVEDHPRPISACDLIASPPRVLASKRQAEEDPTLTSTDTPARTPAPPPCASRRISPRGSRPSSRPRKCPRCTRHSVATDTNNTRIAKV